MTELYFTTLVIHALYHVPQVREQLASWEPRFESGIATDDIGALGMLFCEGLLTLSRVHCSAHKLYLYVHA